MNKKMFYFLRSTQIIALITALTTIFYQLNLLREQSIGLSFEQTETFSYSLTNLAASEAERYINTNKIKDLKFLVEGLSNDPIVRDATIYDDLGKVLYKSKNSIPLKELLKIDDSTANDIDGIVPYIAELFDEDKKVGYILVSLRQNRLLGLAHDYQESSFTALVLVFAMAFLAGMILMAIFFKKAEGAYFGLATRIPELIKSNVEEVRKLDKR